MAGAVAFATPAAATVGERHRLIEQPNAALRNADHRPVLRVTIWYPAAAGAQARSIDFPPDSPLFEVGSVAPDATFRDDKRHPVVLLSHGFGGSARMMAWFGLALAELGYVVIAVDHPGNNGVDPATPAGAVLWWDRADDLKAAFAAVLADPALVVDSLYAALEKLGCRPVRGLQRLRAVNFGAEQARLLKLPVGSAGLALERRSFLGDGRVVEFTRSWYRGDLYDFVAELQSE